MSVAVQIRIVVGGRVLEGGVEVVGLALSAGLLATVLAMIYQWYARERLPDGVAVLAGLTVVAVYLNATAALGQVIAPQPDGQSVLTARTAVMNLLALLGGATLGVAGGRLGAHVARAFTLVGISELEGDVGALVRTVGRVVIVDLPDEEFIEDVESHDPVTAQTKTALAGKSLVFPGGLTIEELRQRLVDRLKTEYDVGVVDVDLTRDGEVAYLAVGSRLAGIGPTLPPGTAATAVVADPPFAAGAGDVVQVWSGGENPERIITAELRSRAGDVVTLAADEDEVVKLSAREQYRLVTVPSAARADREFATLLRAAEETMGVLTIAAESDLVGRTVGEVDVPVVAIRPEDGTVEPLPSRSRTLVPGDTVFGVARPDVIRALESRAQPADLEVQESA